MGAGVGDARSAGPDFAAWLSNLRAEAAGKGISESTLDAALKDVEPIERVIDLDRRQPEFTRTFWTYLERRVTPERVERGRDLLRKHRDLLARVQLKYGVQPRYLVAFWGLETNFGDYLGDFPVVGSLATLAYDERRSDFFRAQLLDALRIVDEGHIESDRMKGSWAGAMGHMQFIPSTFVNNAVDATGDGQKDIWNSLPDVFASAANYLSNVGWKGDEIWGREVRLPQGFDWSLARLEVRKPITEWAAMDVRRANGNPLPKADMEGSIVVPQGHAGPAFLVYDNFRAILRWNRSINYAIAVGHLADRIVGLPPLQNGRDVSNEPLSRDQAKEMQRLLNALGFDAGKPDGLPGPQTRTAIRRFQDSLGRPSDGYPSPALLESLRKRAQSG
jgi:membrane-bound lytic murein transglycosylase B